MSVGVVNAPLKVIVPAVLLSTTLVPVVTAPLKVVPPELVRVRVDNGVAPMAPVILIVPAVPEFIASDCVLAAAPFIVFAKLMFAPTELPPVVSKLTLVPKITASP